MKQEHKLFFAIPFDSATKNLYERVTAVIQKQFPQVTTVIGNKEVGPSPAYANIASFKAQNRELTSQFVAQIRDADVVVADLTHNNPNVHVELGIALMENKNILRVTGRSVTELGFDIRNLEVRQYGNEQDLTKMLIAYLKTFFAIKRLPLTKRHTALYFREPLPIQLRATTERGFAIQSNSPIKYVLRDGAVRATFNILNTMSSDDWFGIYFRSGESPLLGSHLAYVRKNGSIEVARYPGPVIIDRFSLGRTLSGRETLVLEFENNHIDIRLGRARFKSDRLSHQFAGKVAFAAWQSDVDIMAAEIICRDTIEWG